MINFDNVKVMNFEGALRGMRNPLNSWDKSDSTIEEHYSYNGEQLTSSVVIRLGENDLDLAKRLIKAGSDHRKFLRQIFVSVDITAPLYWWKEFDTYKVGTVANSCSTMHKLASEKIKLSDFSIDNFTMEDEEIEFSEMLFNTISDCEYLRRKYLETGDKKYWKGLIQLLPSSYNQKRTVTLNYEVLRNIRHSDRETHKLYEWRVSFMDWIDSLPYAEELLTN